MGAGASSRIQSGLLVGDKLETLAHGCEGLYEDDEFDPSVDVALLGPRFLTENPGLTEDRIAWLRPSEFGTGALFCTGEQVLDSAACLGALDGCNKDLAVALQAICCRRPDYLKSIFVAHNAIVGACAVRLYHNGKMEIVVVDDRVPCRRKQVPPPGTPPHKYSWEPVSCRLTTGEAWLPLLEKALAKLHGSYTATALGDGARDIFRDVCGGEHVLDIHLAHLKPPQLHALFTALHPRFSRDEIVMVARKSHSSTRTWAKKQRCNSVFNLVLHEDKDAHRRDNNTNSYGADISSFPANRPSDTANTLAHVVDQHGNQPFSHIYANAANTDSQSIPAALFYDVMQQAQMLTTRYDETKDEELWDDRKFFVCLSQDEVEQEEIDQVRVQIAHDLKMNMFQDQLAKLSDDEASLGEFAAMDSYKPEWMSWQMFCQDYEQLVLCILPQDGHACKASSGVDLAPGIGQTMHSQWDPTAGTAGGGRHLKSWRNSPLFRLSLKNFKPCTGRLLITTSLPDARKDAYFMDAIPDVTTWDGTQNHGGTLLYPPHAIFVCRDEPTLQQVVVNTEYCQQRDVTVEMDLELDSIKGNFSFVVVPCTYADEIQSDFFLSALFIDEEGCRHEVQIDPLEVWPGYNYTAKVSGQFLKGVNAMGPISKHNMYSFLNPTWRMIIAGPTGEEDNSVQGASTLFENDMKLPSNVAERASSANGPVSTILEGSGDSVENLNQLSQFSQALGEMGGLVDTTQPPQNRRNNANVSGVVETPESSGFPHLPSGSLSYEDVDGLNQSSHISVPSNDTGPYSKSRIRRKDDKPSVRHFQVCTLLSPSTELHTRSRGNSPANSRANTPQNGARGGGMQEDIAGKLPRSGTYLLTPNAYAKLLHNGGECGQQHVNDGFLGKFRFNAYPVTTRHEKFCVFTGGVHGKNYLHRGSDVYEEIYIMAALNDKGEQGSFDLEVICNLPFVLEPVELGQVPAPLKDVANIRAEVLRASRKSKVAAKSARVSTMALSRINSSSSNQSVQRVTISDNTGAFNLDPDRHQQDVDRKGITEQPNFGVGITNMPSFERDMLTNTINATMAREDEQMMDGTDLLIQEALVNAAVTLANEKSVHKQDSQLLVGTGLDAPSVESVGNASQTLQEPSFTEAMFASMDLARSSLGHPVPPSMHEQGRLASMGKQGEGKADTEKFPASIREQLPMLRKSLAKQIRDDTEKKLNGLSIAMWTNENKLEQATKRQYERAAEADRLGVPLDTAPEGGTVFFEPFNDRS